MLSKFFWQKTFLQGSRCGAGHSLCILGLGVYVCVGVCMQVTKAEVKIANGLIQHNIPIAFSDHLSSLLRSAFPDSEIAKSYA